MNSDAATDWLCGGDRGSSLVFKWIVCCIMNNLCCAGAGFHGHAASIGP